MSPDESASEPAASIEAALRAYLAPDRSGSAILLAISGGPDSTALMHAAAQIAPRAPVVVATVDHGLRPEAAGEARAVGVLAARLGFAHTILEWQGEKPTHGLQAAARAARYDLLARHAAGLGAAWVLTAHTRDDQAETVLMRLLAGSGPAGLAGMRAERTLIPGIRLARPFLDHPKATLVAYCARHGLPTLRDPSNTDPRFARARLRRLLPELAAEGLSAERLCRLAERCARDNAALTEAAYRAERAARRPHPGAGALLFDGATLRALPDAVLLRVVALALDAMAPETPLRLERLETLVHDALRPALERGVALRRTLRGILVEVTRQGDLALRAAPPRRGEGRGINASATGNRDGLAAGTADLLGKGEPGAYIADKRPD